MGPLLDVLAIPSDVDVDCSGFSHYAHACLADEDAFLLVSCLRIVTIRLRICEFPLPTSVLTTFRFYNGHLSETRKRLNELDKPEGKSRVAARRYPGTLDRLSDIQEEERLENDENEKDSLSQLREDLAFELTSAGGKVTYPENLTVRNLIDFLFCPTLCYELEYPRTAETNYLELFYKTIAIFGCIFLITITSEEFILPVLAEAGPPLKAAGDLLEQLLILAETTSKLLFPFMVIFLLVFLVTFEYTLGAFAEITCFADRHFYADW